jgi:hypothetical protein
MIVENTTIARSFEIKIDERGSRVAFYLIEGNIVNCEW